jgi:hypothetical protein
VRKKDNFKIASDGGCRTGGKKTEREIKKIHINEKLNHKTNK